MHTYSNRSINIDWITIKIEWKVGVNQVFDKLCDQVVNQVNQVMTIKVDNCKKHKKSKDNNIMKSELNMITCCNRLGHKITDQFVLIHFDRFKIMM